MNNQLNPDPQGGESNMDDNEKAVKLDYPNAYESKKRGGIWSDRYSCGEFWLGCSWRNARINIAASKAKGATTQPTPALISDVDVGCPACNGVNRHHPDCPDLAQPVPSAGSKPPRKSAQSEMCECGHGVSIHGWEDEVTSCCMAHLRLFAGVGEGKPCMCSGFRPTGSKPQEEGGAWPPTLEQIRAASGDHMEAGESERGNFLIHDGKLYILESVAAKAVMRGEERLQKMEQMRQEAGGMLSRVAVASGRQANLKERAEGKRGEKIVR